MEILKAENIHISFDGEKLFDDVSIRLTEGETLCIIGRSGVGKTTLLNILSGLIVPEKGKIFLEGKDITGKPGSISYMQQEDLLFPYYTVLKNVALPLIIRGENEKRALNKAVEHFEFFGLKGYENKYPCELSGGMRQRAALLRTYMQSESVVLLDEPFGALDAATRRKMQYWYMDIARKIGISTVMITHDVDEALIMGNKVSVMAGFPASFISEFQLGEKPFEFELSEEFLRKRRKLLEEIAIQ